MSEPVIEADACDLCQCVKPLTLIGSREHPFGKLCQDCIGEVDDAARRAGL